MLKILAPFLALCMLTTCKQETVEDPYVPFVYTDSITDIDGNVYHTVMINGQEWMAENLRTTRYRNGDTIEYLYYTTDWAYPDDSGAICMYDNNAEAGSIYGNIYNFYAVSDARNIAPAGWHVPTYYEWIGLMAYCGNADAGNRLREHGDKHWLVENGEATDQYGFAALPGGYYDVRTTCNFWSSTHYLPSMPGYPEAWFLRIVGDKDPTLAEPEHELSHFPYVHGCYVRCVKD